jgi:hypothetical protein
MNIKQTPFLLAIRMAVALQLLFMSCAQILAPTGGPRDTEGPKVLECIPENGSVNHASNSFKMKFNEFIQVKDAGSWLISPPQKIPPEYKIKDKTLEVSLKDTLRPNTTYTISFGTSIVDYREGNAMQAYKYVFSTGRFKDSLKISGQALQALSGKPEKDISVLLYSPQRTGIDSFLFKSSPDYFAVTDDKGNFQFDFIPEGWFRVIAIGDKNKNYRYDPPDEWIGYTDTLIPSYDSLTSSIALPLIKYFKESPRQYVKKSDETKPGKFSAVFNRSYLHPQIEYDGKKDSILIIWSKSFDTLHVWDLSLKKDSLRFIISEENSEHRDTVNIRFKKYIASESTEKAAKRARINIQPMTFANGGNQWKRKPGDAIVFIHENPIRAFRQEMSEVYAGKIKIETRWLPDSTDQRKWKLMVPKQYEDSSLKIILPPGTLTDFYYQKNDTLKFQTQSMSAEECGKLMLNISGLTSLDYIIELLNSKGQVAKQSRSRLPVSIEYQMLEPGNYSLRIIQDDNQNGRWDQGNALKMTQPEKVILPSKTFEIRANWDLEEDLNLSE